MGLTVHLRKCEKGCRWTVRRRPEAGSRPAAVTKRGVQEEDGRKSMAGHGKDVGECDARGVGIICTTYSLCPPHVPLSVHLVSLLPFISPPPLSLAFSFLHPIPAIAQQRSLWTHRLTSSCLLPPRTNRQVHGLPPFHRVGFVPLTYSQWSDSVSH